MPVTSAVAPMRTAATVPVPGRSPPVRAARPGLASRLC
jgi:hypothetical protein